MNFYKAIEPFIEHFFSIRKIENFLSFDIEIPKTWGVPKSLNTDGQTIPFESPRGETHRGLSIMCEINDVEVDKTVQNILKLIRVNKEREEKEMLFKDVIADLKKTFESSDLESLKRLNFYFENERTKEIEDDGPTETIGLAE
jgi:hypothetical protein